MVFEENNPGFAEFKEIDDSVTGTLIKSEEDVGANKSKLYTLEQEGNKIVNVWGCTILDQRMVGVKLGDMIKIVYKGLGEAKGGKNPPKIFQVLIDRPAPTNDASLHQH